MICVRGTGTPDKDGNTDKLYYYKVGNSDGRRELLFRHCEDNPIPYKHTMHRQAAQGPQQSDRLRRESDCVVGVCVGGISLNGLSVRPLGLIVAGGPLVLIRVFLTLDLCVKRVNKCRTGVGIGEMGKTRTQNTQAQQVDRYLIVFARINVGVLWCNSSCILSRTHGHNTNASVKIVITK